VTLSEEAEDERNIKKDFNVTVYKDVQWIVVALYRVHWRYVVDTGRYFLVP
jgi:hypothetical protein